jgi:FMN-dependent NADH-azoreductase
MFRALKQRLFRQVSVPTEGAPEIAMTTILHIDSSILDGYSVSRVLSADIVARLQALHPNTKVIYHDLASNGPGHVSGAYMAATRGGAVTDTTLSAELATGNAYIDELFVADIIVIGAPMYNFGTSSQLKAWIDRVVIAGRTFKYDENGVEGLLKAKKLFIASAQGGFYTGESPMAFLDHQEAYLRGVLGFIGLTDITIVRADGINLGEEVKVAAVAKAKAEIAALSA